MVIIILYIFSRILRVDSIMTHILVTWIGSNGSRDHYCSPGFTGLASGHHGVLDLTSLLANV